MKKSIAKQITKKILLLLSIALAILFVASFFTVRKIVYVKSQSYARTILSVYSDLIAYESSKEKLPFGTENSNIPILYGDYICKWYDIEYAYMYIPDIEHDTITFISASEKDNKKDKKIDNNFVGYTIYRTLLPEELAVWNGEKIFGEVKRKNEYGHDITTIIRIEDEFGNKAIVGIDTPYSDFYMQIMQFFSTIALIILIVLIGIYCFVYGFTKKYISNPTKNLSNAMQQFLSGGKSNKIYLDNNNIEEYSVIADSFNKMCENVDKYIGDINNLSREQERQVTELKIASDIQKGFLPKEYVNYPEYDIFAMMKPAKDIGGDLYDYVPLDENRMLFVIADVSGKGISASIFMAVTLMLIRLYAKMGLTPKEIIKKTNDTLSQNNVRLLFATAFVGIYDKRSRDFTYTNAGHNIPYKISDKIEKLDKACGLLLGIYENEKYEEEIVKLNVGDMIFAYTDGVNEATNINGNFYSEERLKKTLAKFTENNANNPVSYVYDSVKEFANDSEQYDDITMLAFCVKDTTELILKPYINEFEKIKNAIMELPIERSDKLNLCLSCEECFVNICSYAFEDSDKEKEKIKFTLSISDKVTLQFEDSGMEFNPVKNLADIGNYDIDTQIGGLGNFIAFSVIDDVRYEYINNKNILTLTKYYKEENK